MRRRVRVCVCVCVHCAARPGLPAMPLAVELLTFVPFRCDLCILDRRVRLFRIYLMFVSICTATVLLSLVVCWLFVVLVR